MIALLHARNVKAILLSASALFLGVPLLSGCDTDAYSADLRYPPRVDPLFKEATVSGAELVYPDKPGQLPVLSIVNAEDPENPLHTPYKANNLLDPRKLSGEQRKLVQDSLEKCFGTPRRPRVQGVSAELAGQFQQSLKLDNRSLVLGSRLYRIQCLHCHGLSGDGRGPTAFWVNPHPRDYRQGIFKFTSVTLELGRQKPRRDDLLRTLREGINGTSMPSFGLLSDDELEQLVSYVIHLSLRGETEYQMVTDLLVKGTLDKEGTAESNLELVGGYWLDAQKPDNEITPESYPYPLEPKTSEELRVVKEAVLRGYNYFVDTQSGCVGCHTDFGRQSKFRYDAWGTLTRPSDLTVGIYRGGRRPLDLYYRIHSGINGSGMLASKTAVSTKKVKSVWDIVKFVEILPYPKMRAQYGIQID